LRVNTPYDPAIGITTLRQRLVNDEARWPVAIGCNDCPDFNACGGISSASKRYDCYDNCCGGKADCQIVCRQNPNFVDQYNEIRGFDLDSSPRTLPLTTDLPNGSVPIIYHGGHRAKDIKLEAVFLRLRELINFDGKFVKFKSKKQLCEHFGIHIDTKVYVTGIDKDKHIEKWWALTSRVRPALIRQLKSVGVSLITTPNYSMMTDVPRLDNLHSMSRIADNFAEFQSFGLAAALHPNSRTEKDFERWAELISSRGEIRTLAYEFGTGSGHKNRIKKHIDGLLEIANRSNRDLDIIVRGNTNVISPLLNVYRNVTFIEASSFMKTVNFKKAIRRGNRRVIWETYQEDGMFSIDRLFEHNIEESSSLLNLIYNERENA